MRVAHTESSINLGGQELRILEQVRWAQDHGHEFWLLARRESAVYREAGFRELPRHAVPFRGSLNPRAILSLIGFVKRRRIDLIDCHSSRDASTAMAARLLSIPVVRTQHVCIALRDDLPHRLTWRLGADRIIAASDSIAARIVHQKLGERSRIRVVGDGIDLEKFDPRVDGQGVRAEFRIPESCRVITLIGMIRPDKGQQYLVRAVDDIVAQVPDAVFFIVGSPTRPEFLARLQAEIDQVLHRDRIILTGFRKDVERFIAASDAIVLTSEIEARSRVIPQAFAMRKPVVASRVGGIPELVQDGRTGFLYPCGDVRMLAKSVVEVLRQHPRAQVENAYALAVSRLSFETMMSETLEVYREVAGTG